MVASAFAFKSEALAQEGSGEKIGEGTNDGVDLDVEMIASDSLRKNLSALTSLFTAVRTAHETRMKNLASHLVSVFRLPSLRFSGDGLKISQNLLIPSGDVLRDEPCC